MHMALFLKQNEERSKLQERLAAELQAKARQEFDGGKIFDAERDSTYLKDTKKTTSLAWAWVLILLLAIGVVVWLISVAA